MGFKVSLRDINSTKSHVYNLEFNATIHYMLVEVQYGLYCIYCF